PRPWRGRRPRSCAELFQSARHLASLDDRWKIPGRKVRLRPACGRGKRRELHYSITSQGTAMTSQGAAADRDGVDLRPGLTYATHDSVALLGDLYLPKGAGPFPALVAVHGGGWVQGARSAFQYWGPYLAARGYALFAASYRLAKAGQKTFPHA